MRILHTSDWHFGRTLHGVDLAPAIDLFCQWLVDTVRRESIDVVLVSGDVYDRPIPSLVAVRQLEKVLSELSELATVVLTSGNHDSSTRLGFASALLRPEIHLVTSVDEVGRGIDLTNKAGERVIIYPIPYLEPESTRYALGRRLARLHEDELHDSDFGDKVAVGRSHQAVMDAALELVNTDLSQRRKNGDNAPAIAMVHAFITGGTPSDSERKIEVGGVQDVRSSSFDLHLAHPLAYIAAGHLHRPQNISGAQVPIRYSGSPVAYSFSEAGTTKSVTLVDLLPGQPVTCSYLPIPVWRDLVTITGTLDEVLSDAHSDKRQAFASITVTDDARPTHLKHRVLQVFPYAVFVTHQSSKKANIAAVPTRHDRRSDQEICASFFTEVGGRSLTANEMDVLQSVLEDLRIKEAQA